MKKVNVWQNAIRNKGKQLIKLSVLIMLLQAISTIQAQELDNDIECRAELDLNYKLYKNITLSFVPEIRFDENFSAEKYLLEGGLNYKLLKFLSLEGKYRYVINPRESKLTEYYGQYAFSIKADKDFGRFNTDFRIRFTNDADDDISNESFLRFKFSLDYDIPDCKITPFISAEAFQQLGNNGGMYKMRYSTGVDYKLFKNNYIGLSYKFDYYYSEYKNKHIIGLGYKFKF